MCVGCDVGRGVGCCDGLGVGTPQATLQLTSTSEENLSHSQSAQSSSRRLHASQNNPQGYWLSNEPGGHVGLGVGKGVGLGVGLGVGAIGANVGLGDG